MPGIPLKHTRLGLANVAPKASDKDVEVTKAGARYKRGADGNPTNEVEGYSIDFIGVKGCEQTVKVPLSAKSSVEAVEKLLAEGKIVRVRFVGLSLKAYAMQREGAIFSGISASAGDVEVTSAVAAEDDDDILLDM